MATSPRRDVSLKVNPVNCPLVPALTTRQPLLAAAHLRFWREEVSTVLTRRLPVATIVTSGRMPLSNFLAPMPLARATHLRRHIGAVEQIAVAVTDGAKRERSNVAILRRRLPPR
jgi:hypothetical protein